jgi:Cu+-exporting ATPase
LKLVKDNIVTKCHHCGEECKNDSITIGDNTFCCLGCRTVFEILNGNDLCSYYTLDNFSGVKVDEIQSGSKFDYLDDSEIQSKLIDFTNRELSSVTFFIHTQLKRKFSREKSQSNF